MEVWNRVFQIKGQRLEVPGYGGSDWTWVKYGSRRAGIETQRVLTCGHSEGGESGTH